MASIFTKIVKGELPSYKIAENEKYFAFLDINPAAEGHTLVIPKKETDYIFDLDAATLAGLFQYAQQVAKAIDAALNPIRTGIIVEGLEVPHAHVHLIPIYFAHQNFSLGKKTEVSEERMRELASLISKHMPV